MEIRRKIPVIITGITTAIITIFLLGCHGCYLHSYIIELVLIILTPTLFCIWTAKAKTTGKAWLRFGLSFIFAILIQLVYLLWLHSPLFPELLLSLGDKH